jgi:hypothetical protein
MNELRKPDAAPAPGQSERRRFFQTAMRYSLLGVIGLVGGRLAARRLSGPLHPDETCLSRGVCRGCRTLATCGSPQATLFRQAKERR